MAFFGEDMGACRNDEWFHDIHNLLLLAGTGLRTWCGIRG